MVRPNTIASSIQLEIVPYNENNPAGEGELADNCPLVSVTRSIVRADGSTNSSTITNPNQLEIGDFIGLPNSSGWHFLKGDNEVTYTALDCGGNEISCSLIVTVVDDEPATITCPAIPPVLTTSSDGEGDCLVCDVVTPGFINDYDFANWTFASQVNEPGAVNGALQPGAIFPGGALGLLGTDGFAMSAPYDDQFIFNTPGSSQASQSTYSIAIPQTGTLQFDWAFPAPSGGEFGYILNGTYTQLANSFDAGNESVSVNMGDTFEFIVYGNLQEVVLGPFPAGVSVSVTNMFVATAPFASLLPTYDDNCPMPTLDSDVQACYGPGWNSITYTITDCGGNISECTVDFMVNDDEDPVITSCPSDQTVNNDPGLCSASLDVAPEATDNCEHTITYFVVGATSASGSADPADGYAPLNNFAFNVGESTVFLTAVDAAGNESPICVFNITVNDNELPVLSCPADVTIGTSANGTGDCSTSVDGLQVPITDNCCVSNALYYVSNGGTTEGPFIVDGTMPPSAALTVDLSGYVFEKGESLVTVEAWDCNGNGNDCSFTVTVADDEAPAFTDCPADIVKESVDGDCSALVTWTEPQLANATDNCLPDCPVTLAGPYISTDADEDNMDLDMGTMQNIQSNGNAFGIFPVGMRWIKYSLTDDAGNVAWCIVKVTVEDNEAPTAVACPADFTVNQDLDCNPTFNLGDYSGLPVFDDNCAIVSIAQVPANGTAYTPADGDVIAVTVTATDGAGLTASCSFNVTIEDNSGPTIACPANQTVYSSAADVDGDCQLELPDYTGAGTAQNSCGNEDPTVTQSPAAGNTYTAGMTVTVTLTATDGAGNQTSCDFDVTFADDVLPTGVCAADPATATAPVGGCSAPVSLTPPTITDCGAVTIWGKRSDLGEDLTSANGYAGEFEACETTVTWYAQDAAGNIAEICENTVTVVEPLNEDNEPTAICQGALVLGLKNNGEVELCAETYGINSFDNCDNSTLTYQIHIVGQPIAECITFDCSHIGEQQICLIVTDCSGNQDLCYSTVTIQDKRDPFIQCPADITIECHVDNGGAPATGPALPVINPFDQIGFDNWNNVVDAGQDAANGITGYAQGWDNCSGEVSFSDESTQGNDPTQCDYYSYTVTQNMDYSR